AAALVIAGATAAILDAAPASAATSSDSIYVFDDPTNISEPLPAGTPDVVIPLMTALSTGCAAIDQAVPTYEVLVLSGGEVNICNETFPRPTGFVVAGVSPVGLWMPAGGWGTPGCGVAVYEFPGPSGSTIMAGIAPPGATC
ncbi:MAG TPA: hypothetical protein VE991_12810, partial [Acidimicrobiales bacterium]|nr:hypothetical protein [Acidimicrobiales bacterium]